MAGLRGAKQVVFSATILLLAFNYVPLTSAQRTMYVSQIGAWGDDASKGNMGVRAEIRTHVYNASYSDFDYFWVGDNLEGGAFVQFGYSFEPGYACLSGKWYASNLTCNGAYDNVGISDARWQWQYWPNASLNNFYYGVGPAASAGNNGTWHMYSIQPNSAAGWSFTLDGVEVANLSVQPQRSKDAAYVIAEKVTDSSVPQTLGPVEFRGLSYLNKDGWQEVDTLYVAKGCSIQKCEAVNPYGVSLDGPNHVTAGSGQGMSNNGEFLWTTSYVALGVSVHPGTKVLVTTVFGSEVLDNDATVNVPRGMFVEISQTGTRAPATGVPGLVGAVDAFGGWKGNVSSTSTTLSLLMSGDEQIQGVWTTDYTVPILLVGIALAALLTIPVLAIITRKARHPRLGVYSQCPNCGRALHFVYQYRKWYCFNCRAYI